VVCSFAPTPAVHVLDHDRGISEKMFLQKREHGFYAEITGATRRRGSKKRDSLSLVKIVLRICKTGNQTDHRAKQQRDFCPQQSFTSIHFGLLEYGLCKTYQHLYLLIESI
jgi:hypothetical protein